MSGGDAAGEVPVSEPRAARVQPTNGPGSDLGQPVPLVDVLANMAPEFARNTRSDLENLERRLADRQMLDELAARNFTGRRYQRFENELARYGMSVLRGWMHSGYIFKLTAARGFALHPSDAELEELFRDPDAREELAIMTVALALPRFREHALIRGGWRFEGGASVTTYFVGACVYVFPNELRKRRAQREKWRRQDHGDPALAAPREDHISNPELITIGSMQVRGDLERLDPRTRAVLALTLDGYSQDEIVELLGETSIRAVEGLLHRWRKKEQSKANKQGGGEPHGQP